MCCGESSGSLSVPHDPRPAQLRDPEEDAEAEGNASGAGSTGASEDAGDMHGLPSQERRAGDGLIRQERLPPAHIIRNQGAECRRRAKNRCRAAVCGPSPTSARLGAHPAGPGPGLATDVIDKTTAHWTRDTVSGRYRCEHSHEDAHDGAHHSSLAGHM